LLEFRRRTALIDVIDLAFNHDCSCEVCTEIRKIASDLEDLFMPKTVRGR